MSRNFDLMQEMEKERAFHSSGIIEAAFPIPGESRDWERVMFSVVLWCMAA
jgi:hypothetical protein